MSEPDTTTGYILITGANGLVGHHLCRRLLQTGRRVLALSRSEKPALLQSISDHPQLTLLKGDIGDAPCMTAIFHSYNIDTVFHLAVERYLATGVPPKPLLRETNAYRTNYLGTVSLLEIAIQHSVRYWAQGSAMLVYDLDNPPPLPVSETALPNPAEPNGFSILLAEQAVRYLCRKANLPTLILRYPGIFGSGKSNGLIAGFVRRCVSGDQQPFTAASDRSADFIYVEDVVSANMLALAALQQGKMPAGNATSGHPDNIYHIGSGREVSVADICRLIRKISGSDIPLNVESTGHPRRFWFDISRARQDLDFMPQPLEKALEKYIDSIRIQMKMETV